MSIKRSGRLTCLTRHFKRHRSPIFTFLDNIHGQAQAWIQAPRLNSIRPASIGKPKGTVVEKQQMRGRWQTTLDSRWGINLSLLLHLSFPLSFTWPPLPRHSHLSHLSLSNPFSPLMLLCLVYQGLHLVHISVSLSDNKQPAIAVVPENPRYNPLFFDMEANYRAHKQIGYWVNLSAGPLSSIR